MHGDSWPQLSWEPFDAWKWLMRSSTLMQQMKGSWMMHSVSTRRSCVGAKAEKGVMLRSCSKDTYSQVVTT